MIPKNHALVLTLFAFSFTYATSFAQWSTGTNIYNTNTGNVGIGTTAPTEKLHVNGLLLIPGAGTTNDNSPGIIAISDDDFLYDGQYINNYGFGFHTYSDPATGALTTNGTNTYVSGYYGIDFFTKGIQALRISNNGNVGIGTLRPDYKLTVNGKIKCEEAQVVVDVPADYVFLENYDLKTLDEVEQFINTNKHLPGIPASSEIVTNGWDVGVMSNKLLEKIEELTLYMIQLKKENEDLRKRLDALGNQN